MTDNDWLSNFVITKDDLNRLEVWLGEQNRGVTLEEMTRRIIRGRLRWGRDESPSALPEWVQEKHILSWNEEEKWCVGCDVLVAFKLDDKIVPFFGIIIATEEAFGEKFFYVQEKEKVVCYKRVEPGSDEAKTFLENIRKCYEQQPEDINEQINVIILKYGAHIATQIRGGLEIDARFVFYKNYWFLQNWIPEISPETLQNAHLQIWKTSKRATLQQLIDQMPGLPDGEVGEIGLIQALSKIPELFQPCETDWLVIPPPPPPWQKAIGAFYVYDPDTYEIILKPGERLKKKIADRLVELGFYADVVAEAAS